MRNDGLDVSNVLAKTYQIAFTNVVFETLTMVVFSFIVKIFWNMIAPTFFASFLPLQYLHVTYLNVFGLYVIAVFLGLIIKRVLVGFRR